MSFSRREFGTLAAKAGLASLASLSAARLARSQAPGIQASLSIDRSSTLAVVPADYMGLSYESGQLAYPDFFAPENTALVGLFRTLSPNGVLRLGGNLSEFTIWSDTEPATPPERGGLVGPDPGHREPRTFTITPKSIRNLQGFLSATGWRCIYGLNLGGGSLEQALAEGSFVARTLGPHLIAVQFGNEPDLFKHHDQNNKPWTFDEYLTKWKTFRAAFHSKLPNVAVAGPDTAFNQKWVKQFLDAVPKEVVMATSHYYPEGPPTDPKMTIDLLMHPGERFETSCREALQTSKAAGLPFRMAEGNSCYNAGKPGVSDTFASALWAGDFCLQMAAMGCVGVNLHGGANGYYSPITGSLITGFEARPEYYGLMLAQTFAGQSLLKTTFDAQGGNLTAYAAKGAGNAEIIAIFNKDEREASVLIPIRDAVKKTTVQRLEAPAIDSKSNVTFAGSSVAADGAFHAQPGSSASGRVARLSIRVAGYSAALIHMG